MLCSSLGWILERRSWKGNISKKNSNYSPPAGEKPGSGGSANWA